MQATPATLEAEPETAVVVVVQVREQAFTFAAITLVRGIRVATVGVLTHVLTLLRVEVELEETLIVPLEQTIFRVTPAAQAVLAAPAEALAIPVLRAILEQLLQL